MFKNVKSICQTVDLWSSGFRGFFGVTAHWIDETTLKRKAAALSCAYFEMPHTNDRIAEHLQILNHEYGIAEKIVATVSDNASNFVKAFNEFGTDWNGNEIESDDTENIIEFFGFDTCQLSCHKRCGSHTVNLIMKNDAMSAFDDGFYWRSYHAAMRKVENLWKAINGQKSFELMKKHLNSSINRPTAVRWNSRNDSIVSLLKKDQEKLKCGMMELQLETLSPIDIDFLQEYTLVLKPVANLLDNFQKSDCYYAIYLPSLCATIRKLEKMKQNNEIKFCMPLIDALLNGIKTRFATVLDIESDECQAAIIAACTHPHFKLRWISDSFDLQKVKEILLKAAEEFQIETNKIVGEKKSSKFNFAISLLSFCL